MIEADENSTIGEVFQRAVQAYAARPFLAVPAGKHRPYHQEGREIDYTSAGVCNPLGPQIELEFLANR